MSQAFPKPAVAGPDVYDAALTAGPDFFTDEWTIQISTGLVPGQVPWMQVVTDDADMPLAFALARGTFATATATATAIKVYPDLDLNLVGKITTEARQFTHLQTTYTIYRFTHSLARC